jgi:hypothetical protein
MRKKYKAETVRGSNVVDLVNDVLRKRKYFNPQGWETFEEALREANVPQDLILRTVSSIPMLFNLYKRPFCQTRSKALLMSPNITIYFQICSQLLVEKYPHNKISIGT